VCCGVVELARSCVGGDEDLDYAGVFPDGDWEKGDDCYEDVRRGACYFAFPMCSKGADQNQNAVIFTGEALPICYEQCIRERAGCRTYGSAFGSFQQIEKECQGGPWSLEEMDSGLCTGAGHSLSPNKLVAVVVSLTILVAQLVV